MSKKIAFILMVVFVSFFSFHFAYAGVVINEVKYSPTTKQWIEIYNDTDNDIDITTYRILDSGAVTNGHGVVATDGGSNFIPKHGFGIIAKVPNDFGTVSFPLFKSSLNIKVSGDSVILRNDQGENISSVSIDGSAIDGNSFQLINNTWEVAVPTPGIQNYVSTVPDGGNNTSGGSSSNFTVQNIPEVKTKIVEPPTIKTKIITKNIAFTGLPNEFKANVLGYSDEVLRYGKCFWNFGDGASKEQINNFEKFYHTYSYPGEYIVSLEYYTNYYNDIPDVTNKIKINVVPLSVFISKIGDGKDFFVEIKNNSDYEIDISNWSISSLNKRFVFPKNTIISSNGKIVLSPKITNFTTGEEKDLKLMNFFGETVHFYKPDLAVSDEVYQLNNVQKTIALANRTETTSLPENTEQGTITEEVEVPIFNDNLSSNVIKTDISKEKNSPFFFIGFIILLIVSSVAVYFIRRKKVVLVKGDDFEILDE
ncbi:MAG: lamin tail domain-containing protein [bacterium]